jgi:hypothetical protein
MDLRDANSWPLRSPGILSRRALCRFLLRRRQLLDQPSKPMRNPSHQLNAKKWSKGHARLGDRRADGLIPPSRSRLVAMPGQVPRDCGGKRRSAPLSAAEKCEEYFALRRGPGAWAGAGFPALPFLRHGAQIVIVQPVRPAVGPFKQWPSSPFHRRNSQPRCAASSR